MLSKIHPGKTRTQMAVAQVFTLLYMGIVLLAAMPFDFDGRGLVKFLLHLTAVISVFFYLMPTPRRHPIRVVLLPYAFGVLTVLALLPVIAGMNRVMQQGGGLYTLMVLCIQAGLIATTVGCGVGSMIDAHRSRMLKWSAMACAVLQAGLVMIFLIRYSGFYVSGTPTGTELMEMARRVAESLFYMGIFIYTLEP